MVEADGTACRPGNSGWELCDGRLPSWRETLVAAALDAGEDVAAALELAEIYGTRLAAPGDGATAMRWQLLADVAAQDLTAGRVLEAHADALAILAEAGERAPTGRWGVFAAEASDVSLVANSRHSGWTVEGTKPWCSLGSALDHALVTARAGAARRLFAVDLRHPSVRADPPSGWVSRGLRAVPSGPVHFSATPAEPIGGPNWYLTRPGFAWGGIGVAACWYGGAHALAERLIATASRGNRELLDLAVGAVDIALHATRACLSEAARLVDCGLASGDAGEILALRVRSVTADAVERTLTNSGHALGPAPLAFDERHARRVADLEIYVRQHHAEKDLVALGRRVSSLSE